MDTQSEKVLTLISIEDIKRAGYNNPFNCGYFWSAKLIARRGPYPMKIDIGYIIHYASKKQKYKASLKRVWIAGTKDGEKENVDLKDRLHAIGYDTSNLLEDIKPLLINLNIIEKEKIVNKWINKFREKIKKYKNRTNLITIL